MQQCVRVVDKRGTRGPLIESSDPGVFEAAVQQLSMKRAWAGAYRPILYQVMWAARKISGLCSCPRGADWISVVTPFSCQVKHLKGRQSCNQPWHSHSAADSRVCEMSVESASATPAQQAESVPLSVEFGADQERIIPKIRTRRTRKVQKERRGDEE